MRRCLPVLLLTLSQCGSGAGSGLAISAEPGAAVIPASLAGSELASVALVGGDEEVAVIWSSVGENGATEIVGQSLSESLVPVAPAQSISGSAERSRVSPAACRPKGGTLAVAWTDGYVELPVGVTLDEANVPWTSAWPPTGPSAPANPDTLGVQERPSIACLPNGERVVAWNHTCSAVERTGGGLFYFRPDECDSEPGSGAYLRIFGEDGEPLSDAIAIREQLYAQPKLAAVGPDDFLSVADTQVQTWKAGSVVAEQSIQGLYASDSSLACVGRACVVARMGWLILIDSTDLDSYRFVYFDERTGADGHPENAHVACDLDGTCLVTWVLVRTTHDGDAVFTEFLGSLARAFDLRSGKLGGTFTVEGPSDYDSGTLVAAISPGGFVLARASGDDIALSKVSVR